MLLLVFVLFLVPAALLIFLWTRHFQPTDHLRTTLLSLETCSHVWPLLVLLFAGFSPDHSRARTLILFANISISGLTFILALATQRGIRTYLAVASLFTCTIWVLLLAANSAF